MRDCQAKNKSLGKVSGICEVLRIFLADLKDFQLQFLGDPVLLDGTFETAINCQ